MARQHATPPRGETAYAALVEIIYDVNGELFPMPEAQAEILAGNLRLTARGEFGGAPGRAAALALAEVIEERLVGESETPIPLAGVAAVAIWYQLNLAVSTGPTPLYLALSPPKERWLADGSPQPLTCTECGRSPAEDEDAGSWTLRRDELFEYPFCPSCDKREFGGA